MSPLGQRVSYVTGEGRKNSSKMKEEAGPKWKQCSAVGVSGVERKV